MKIQEPSKPSEISIFVPNINPNKRLVDYRLYRRYGNLNFGTISQLGRNLGLIMKIKDDGIIFTGPRKRVQMFVEKLHFAMVPYKLV